MCWSCCWSTRRLNCDAMTGTYSGRMRVNALATGISWRETTNDSSDYAHRYSIARSTVLLPFALLPSLPLPRRLVFLPQFYYSTYFTPYLFRARAFCSLLHTQLCCRARCLPHPSPPFFLVAASRLLSTSPSYLSTMLYTVLSPPHPLYSPFALIFSISFLSSFPLASLHSLPVTFGTFPTHTMISYPGTGSGGGMFTSARRATLAGVWDPHCRVPAFAIPRQEHPNFVGVGAGSWTQDSHPQTHTHTAQHAQRRLRLLPTPRTTRCGFVSFADSLFRRCQRRSTSSCSSLTFFMGSAVRERRVLVHQPLPLLPRPSHAPIPFHRVYRAHSENEKATSVDSEEVEEERQGEEGRRGTRPRVSCSIVNYLLYLYNFGDSS
ncbi:hypothetical protein DFH08DRAFT_887636 [Mycena albidolilacea]|uniref:Uncharacterized protein n=1 Tax=Mycena albidolilacea TaxID=1033008 RepID=A0AAD6ZIN9_9AGAR|nr:hypothetical protein DFH08DRAFT_887636 [Mycena albidolilacea]